MPSEYFVIVLASNGKEQEVVFDETTTLAEFRSQIRKEVYGIEGDDDLSTMEDLKLFWCGIHIKEGASWHTGRIDENDLMKDLSPDLKNGYPEIHAHLRL